MLGARPEADALSVYAEPSGGGFRHVPAVAWDHEGVACIDDVARAVVLYCSLWRDHGISSLRPVIARLINFVLHMQGADGAFVNFIVDWTGRPNLTSPTSRPGGPWWTARAMHALSSSLRVVPSDEVHRAFLLGRTWLHQYESVGALAVAVEAELEYWQVTQDPMAARFCLRAAEAMADHRSGHVLADDSEVPHLWGHHQERAILHVAAVFDRPDLSDIAIASAFELFGPAVVSGFAGPGCTVPYEVSCASDAFDAVHRASGNDHADELANLARAWFYGRNTAAAPVYDTTRQLIYDGVDGEIVSPNAGAESNLEAARSLYRLLPWSSLAVGRTARD